MKTCWILFTCILSLTVIGETAYIFYPERIQPLTNEGVANLHEIELDKAFNRLSEATQNENLFTNPTEQDCWWELIDRIEEHNEQISSSANYETWYLRACSGLSVVVLSLTVAALLVNWRKCNLQ